MQAWVELQEVALLLSALFPGNLSPSSVPSGGMCAHLQAWVELQEVVLLLLDAVKVLHGGHAHIAHGTRQGPRAALHLRQRLRRRLHPHPTDLSPTAIDPNHTSLVPTWSHVIASHVSLYSARGTYVSRAQRSARLDDCRP